MKKSIKNLAAILAAAALAFGLGGCSTKSSTDDDDPVIRVKESASFKTYDGETLSEGREVTYNTAGLPLTEDYYVYDEDGGSTINSHNTFTYDENNVIVSSTQLLAPATEPFQTVYNYDDNGILKSVITYWQEGGSIYYETLNDEFDSDGNCTKYSFLSAPNEGEEPELVNQTVLKYENGRVSECIVYEADGVTLFSRSVYKYTKSGKKTSENIYDYDNVLSQITTYTWNKKGNLTSEKDSDADGDVYHEIDYTYDSSNNEILKLEYSVYEGEKTLTYKTTGTYVYKK